MPEVKGMEEPIKSGTAGTPLDKVLECLDSINKRLDSIEEEDKKREKARKDAKRRRKNDDDDDVKHARHDDDDDEEEEEEKKRRKDAKRRKDDDDDEEDRNREYGEPKTMRYDSIAADNRRREQLAYAQSRADSVSQALLNQDAPAPMSSERISDYRRRLLRPFLNACQPAQ
jgi:hypothetical protein